MGKNLAIFLCCMSVMLNCNKEFGRNHVDRIPYKNSESSDYGDTVTSVTDSIIVVFQDKRDFYWFGSNGAGVYRYDGLHLIQFTTSNGLADNHIIEIKEDQEGNLYFNTLNGISIYDGKEFASLEPTNNILIANQWKLEEGDLWFKGKPGARGPLRFDGQFLYQLEFPRHFMEDEFNRKYPNAAFSPYEIFSMYKDRRGNMWFGTANFGLCRYDGNKLSWMFEEHLTTIGGHGAFGIRSIIEDREGYFWICNTRYRYDFMDTDSISDQWSFLSYTKLGGLSTSKTIHPGGFPYFMSAVKDEHGDLWMLSYDEGVWKYDGQKLIHFPVKNGEMNVRLFSIYNDKQGDLWLGTHTDGPYKLNGDHFKRFLE